MAYTNGTETSIDDVLDNLRAFLVTNGWSVDLWADYTHTYRSWSGLVGSGKRLHVHRTMRDATTGYFHLRSVYRGCIQPHYYPTSTQSGGYYYAEVPEGLCCYNSTGYDGGEEWAEQPNYPLNTAVCLTGAPGSNFDYWFFHHTDTCTVCIKSPTGFYRWFSFGMLVKAGTYTGGYFAFGESSGYRPWYNYHVVSARTAAFLAFYSDYTGNGHVYFDDGVTTGHKFVHAEELWEPGQIKLPFPNPRVSMEGSGNQGLAGCLFQQSPNVYNAGSPFVPAHILYHASVDSRFVYLGYIEGLRMVHNQHYAEGEEVSLGGDTWKILPFYSKDEAHSVNYLAYAVKK